MQSSIYLRIWNNFDLIAFISSYWKSIIETETIKQSSERNQSEWICETSNLELSLSFPHVLRVNEWMKQSHLSWSLRYLLENLLVLCFLWIIQMIEIELWKPLFGIGSLISTFIIYLLCKYENVSLALSEFFYRLSTWVSLNTFHQIVSYIFLLNWIESQIDCNHEWMNLLGNNYLYLFERICSIFNKYNWEIIISNLKLLMRIDEWMNEIESEILNHSLVLRATFYYRFPLLLTTWNFPNENII
jgi:hypothetical protein